MDKHLLFDERPERCWFRVGPGLEVFFLRDTAILDGCKIKRADEKLRQKLRLGHLSDALYQSLTFYFQTLLCEQKTNLHLLQP